MNNKNLSKLKEIFEEKKGVRDFKNEYLECFKKSNPFSSLFHFFSQQTKFLQIKKKFYKCFL